MQFVSAANTVKLRTLRCHNSQYLAHAITITQLSERYLEVPEHTNIFPNVRFFYINTETYENRFYVARNRCNIADVE